jgi:hypothetical protein
VSHNILGIFHAASSYSDTLIANSSDDEHGARGRCDDEAGQDQEVQTADVVDVKTRKLRTFFCAMQPPTTAFSRARMPDGRGAPSTPMPFFCGAAPCATKISIPCLDRVYINPTSAAVVARKNESSIASPTLLPKRQSLLCSLAVVGISPTPNERSQIKLSM